MSMSQIQSLENGRLTSGMPNKENNEPDRSTAKQFMYNLKTFLTDVWLDIVVLVILGATAASVWVAPNTFNRLFPVTFFDGSGDIVWTQFAFPYVPPLLNSAVAGLVCGLVPLSVILIAQVWNRNFDDASHGILGLAHALVTGTLFQVILKKTIGGLRPHFLSVCEPRLPTNPTNTGTGFGNIMFDIDQVCHGDKGKIQNAVESFPSGHAQVAWAGLGYLAIYLFTHLDIQSQRRLKFWRMTLVLGPFLLATFISSSLVLTYNHHVYDVIAGGLIGSFVALFSYRMAFAAILDGNWNCVPRCNFKDIEKKKNTDMDSNEHAPIASDEPVLPI